MKLLVAAVLLACSLRADPKPPPTPTAKTGNAQIEMTATLYCDRAAIQQLLGSDLGGYYVVVDVRLAPKAEVSIYPWKASKDQIPQAVRQVRDFLRAHHPVSAAH